MMKTLISRYTVFILSILVVFQLASCDGYQEQIIPVDITVEDVSTVVVFNGEIEKDSNVWIQISYSNDIDAPTGTSVTYEKNATVVLKTAGGLSENLKHWERGIYYGTDITGIVNETYTLTVDIEGKQYSASSTMYPEPGFQGAWVASPSGTGGKGSYGGYEEEWIVNDPSDERNRYLFEWHTNGLHFVRTDWAIDDNRVVNYNEGLRLVNPTRGINANEHTLFRAAEIDKVTYDYYNMYEKIVRGLVGASSQTPFNPVSNFGEGTMGNFRAVEFSSIVILTPPGLLGQGQNNQNVIIFPLNAFFKKYNLYWSTFKGVTKDSEVLKDIKYLKVAGGEKDDKGSKGTSANSATIEEVTGVFIHPELENGKNYYYRIEVEDAEGTVSVLSPEIVLSPDSNVPADNNPNIVKGKAPKNVQAVTGNKTGEIVISWDAAEDAQQYGIYYSTKSGITGSSKENSVWGGKNGATVKSPFILTGLKSGTTYYFRVASFDGTEIHLSEEVSAVAK